MWVQFNIGRNVNDVPMSQYRWLDFTHRTVRGLVRLGADYDSVEIHDGVGTFDGITEDSRHIAAMLRDDVDVNALMAHAAELETGYDQDMVAVLIGK